MWDSCACSLVHNWLLKYLGWSRLLVVFSGTARLGSVLTIACPTLSYLYFQGTKQFFLVIPAALKGGHRNFSLFPNRGLISPVVYALI